VLDCHLNEWKNNTFLYIYRRQDIDDVFINCGISTRKEMDPMEQIKWTVVRLSDHYVY
jgi:hypothetical protein